MGVEPCTPAEHSLAQVTLRLAGVHVQVAAERVHVPVHVAAERAREGACNTTARYRGRRGTTDTHTLTAGRPAGGAAGGTAQHGTPPYDRWSQLAGARRRCREAALAAGRQPQPQINLSHNPSHRESQSIVLSRTEIDLEVTTKTLPNRLQIYSL